MTSGPVDVTRRVDAGPLSSLTTRAEARCDGAERPAEWPEVTIHKEAVMTTFDHAAGTSVPAPTTHTRSLAGVTLRRWTGGAALLTFAAVLVPQALIDPASGGSGATMFTAATEHRTALLTAAAMLVVSALLTVPASVAVLRQARDRGAALANVGATAAVLGGFGHLGIGFFYVLAAALPGGERAEMVAYVDRLNESTALAVLAFPLITCFAVGMLLLPWAAFRAGLIGWWGPAAGTVAVLLHVATPPEVADVVSPVSLALLAAVFGFLGARTLRMPDRAWVGSRA
jgi:hypothetical protein